MYVNRNRKVLSLVFSLVLLGTSAAWGQDKRVAFEKSMWLADSSGAAGYRLNISMDEMYLLLLGKSREQVLHILGQPKFIVEKDKGFSLNYCIESKSLSEAECGGSFISVYFKEEFVDDVIVVWKGG